MDRNNIWSHISKRLTGEEAVEDTENVDKWLTEKPVNKEIYKRLSDMWNFEEQSSENYESLFDSILRRIKVYENRPAQPIYKHFLFKAAAIFIFLLATNIFVYLQTKQSTDKGQLVYQEIVVPRGNRMQVILPDSSTVWLNNESKLRYASNFGEGHREVELSGEAYFNVTHDSEHPFFVKIGGQQIKVLGTRFSVNAYPEDNLIETSLISGSVEFETNRAINGKSAFLLEPGFSLFYDKQKNSITQQKIQSSYYEYWDNGMYAFKDESLESLAVKIKRIFNVEIVLEEDFLKSKTYTGTISINDNIFIFMEAIRRTSVEPIEYKFNKNIIYVKLKK